MPVMASHTGAYLDAPDITKQKRHTDMFAGLPANCFLV